jgi:hypothetical protein
MNEIVNFDGVQFKKDKLIIKEGMDFKTWEKLGHALKAMQGAIQWWVGDWLNYGEKHYGETYAQALEATDYSYEYLRNVKSVANKVPMSHRCDNLTFSHHIEIASCKPEDQEKYLNIAKKENLSRIKLRERIKKDVTGKEVDISKCKHKNIKEVHILSCPDCGYKYKEAV